MIVDTSALLAILFDEPDAPSFVAAIEVTYLVRLSSASYLEAALRLEYIDRADILDPAIARLGLLIEPVTAAHARIAREANRRFGKGRHPAQLNFGDCMVYALARATGEPLLFKGDDFGHTDLVPALNRR